MENSWLGVFPPPLHTEYAISLISDVFWILMRNYPFILLRIPYIWWILCLLLFSRVSFCLSTVIRWCLCMDLFQFILLGICWASWMFLINISYKFDHYFLKILFLSLYLFSLLLVLSLCICLYAWWWPKVSQVLFIFLWFFFLCVSQTGHSQLIYNFTDSTFCNSNILLNNSYNF